MTCIHRLCYPCVCRARVRCSCNGFKTRDANRCEGYLPTASWMSVFWEGARRRISLISRENTSAEAVALAGGGGGEGFEG